MSPLSLARLCAFSYLHLPESLVRRLPAPLGEIALSLLEAGKTDCETLSPEQSRVLAALGGHIETAGLRLLEYADWNRSSGFAAYSFASRDGHVIAMRGSERRDSCAPTDADWWDNFIAPLCGSAQYAALRAFVARYPIGKLVITGHSKGGHNALYGLAESPNALARAVAFNAQGFGSGQLTQGEKSRLRERGVNYVTAGDLVGLLLEHPERRVFARRCSAEDARGGSWLKARARGVRAAHLLESICFTDQGDPIPFVD